MIEFFYTTYKLLLLKKRNILYTSAFAVLFFLPGIFLGQEENEVFKINSNDISTLLYGTSDELINGKFYLPEHPLAKGSPFYKSQARLNGTIFIKGNEYPKQVFGYNIAEEKVILSAFQKNGTRIEVEMDETIIDSMAIENTFFVNGAVKIIPGFDKGFIEIIYKGGFLFIEKHKKNFVSQYSSSSPNGFYTNDQAEYYLIFDTIPIKINSKKSILKEFESNQKEIKKYMKSVKFKFKKANQQQWVGLLNYCDNLASR